MLKRCYIYTRVSTAIQVEGFSLDAQKVKLKKYADAMDMQIIDEFSDEGKSGKNIDGRPGFQEMLKRIKAPDNNIDFVLVYKLSRFGRNTADVMNSLQTLQDNNVNLICVDDGIDNSKGAGKLIISVLSAVAEIERENILVQTMEGRKQKAREGKWNGGFAPYGYALIEGELQIADDEKEVIEIIYDKFVHTNLGIAGVARFLEQQGYKKKKRQNNTIDGFSTTFVKAVLDNPVYKGKIAFGRRKTVKQPGQRNQFKIVKQQEYPIYNGIHTPIVSEELWQAAQDKRQHTGVRQVKTYNLDHANILSGIIRCPICGATMFGNVNRKKKKDGTLYKDHYYYQCKHRMQVDGHKCDYRKQWKQETIDEAVAEIISKLVNNANFATAIQNKINSKVDTSEIEKELSYYYQSVKQTNTSIQSIARQLDNLDFEDKQYQRKYDDMQNRLNALYDKLSELDDSIEETEQRLNNIKQDKLSADNIYKFLIHFDKLYPNFSDIDKKIFMKSFVESVDIYKEKQENGRILKAINFKFPVFYEGVELKEISWDKDVTVECVVLLSQQKPGDEIDWTRSRKIEYN